MLQELAEQLSISFHNKVKHHNQGHGHGHGALFIVANPSDGNIIASRAHTASHRTHERNETISRLDSPPNLRCTEARLLF